MKKYGEDTNARIYQKTMNLIKLYGIKGWNMDMLCKEVNISKDTLYRIIKSKKQLLTSMMIELIEEHAADIDAILSANQDFYLVLENLSQKIAGFLYELESVQLKSLFNEYPEIEEMVVGYADQFDDKIISYLVYGVEINIIDAKVDTVLVAKSIKYMSLALLSDGASSNANDAIAKYIHYIFEGIKKR